MNWHDLLFGAMAGVAVAINLAIIVKSVRGTI